MKNNWKDFVQFSSSERRGIIALSLIAIISAAYSYFAPKWVSNRQIAAFEEKYAEALQKARNYNDSIASFTKLQNADSNSIDDYTPLDANEFTQIKQSDLKLETHQRPLDLNSITAQQLIKGGIVESEIAYRIIKFRDGLGGFYTKNQLMEVFGVTDVDYQKLITKVEFNNTSIRKININKASVEELQAHSYISPKLANQIINYREKVKPFSTSDDVLKLYMVDNELHSKLMPYIQL